MDPEAIQLLREIRDETRQTNARLDQTVSRLDQTIGGGLKVGFDQANSRLEAIETAVLEFAEQQRFVVRYLRTLTERDRGIDEDVLDLRRRVEQIEARLGPG
jgi:hypothetical protein